MYRSYREQTQRIVDEEAARLLQQAEERAVALLRDHREALDARAELLTVRETVDGSVVLEVLQQQHQRPDGHHSAATGKPTLSPCRRGGTRTQEGGAHGTPAEGGPR
ncbi:hypothetical protein OH767_05255 [Streptomyces sp. NBC_01614]